MKGLLGKLYGRFKEPSDVYGAVHPLYCVCSLVGLAPYSIRRLENGKKAFQSAVWPMIKSVMLVVFYVSIAAYNVFFHRAAFRNTDIKDKMRYFQEIFTSLLSCCSVVFGCIFATRIVEVFRNVDEVDTAFRSLAVWVPYKTTYVKIVVHLSVFATGVFLTIIDMSLFPMLMDSEYGSTSFLTFMTFMTVLLPYFINLVMEFQYFHYLSILRMRYKLLNEYLEALVQENKSYNGWMDEDVTTVSSKTKGEKAELFGSGKIPRNIVAISDPVFIVDQVASLHIKLTDTAHMINYAFCVQQLLRITVAFVSIVSALFWIAVNFSQSSEDDDDDGVQLDIFFITWAFSNACEVMMIVWITSETCEEANTCPRILHKIRNNTTNVKLQDTIEIYSLQMYHNRLSFTVCGLFPLDYTLLYTIVAGVTTYLVILIQFNNADFVKKYNNVTANATI